MFQIDNDDDEDVVAERGEDAVEDCIELYDSGCTNHVSPFRERFENYTDISLKRFRAANQQTFDAIGRGELVVDLPNGSESSPLRLENALYAPDLYTLVSIGQLDEAGFLATIGGGNCAIIDSDGNQIGSIPKTAKRLPEQFHRRMGHVSIKTACKLVKDKHVIGVRLEDVTDIDKFFCESCVYAKATRKRVPKRPS